jgi:uncharacterized membrane protein YhhN
MTRNSTTLVGLAIAAALLAITGSLARNFWLIVAFKPLATILILALAWHNWRCTKQSFAFWICIGLLFSLAGDILLIWPDKFFVLGLAAFLLAHFAYLAAFTRGVKFPARWSIWFAFLALATANVFLLRPNLPNALVLPVVFYAVALSTMTAQAIGRSLLLHTSVSTLAAIGALFFLLSDSLLSWDRFHHALPFASVLILAPYYTAQLLIALSTRPAASA